MLVDGLVMAAAVTVVVLAVLTGTMPERDGRPSSAHPNVVDVVLVVVLALAGSFGFGVLAAAGGH